MKKAALTVFLGSSSEAAESGGSMDLIAKWIEELGHQPVPWNEPGLFPPGAFTYEVLLEVTRTVDAAILIFAEDDKAWYRGSPRQQPRDNVLLEYGLFSAALGTRRAIVVRDGKPAIPADLSGVTYVSMDGRRRARSELKIWLESLHDISAQETIPFYLTKHTVPGANRFWRTLHEQAVHRFILLGETNKSWIARTQPQTEQFVTDLTRVIANGGEVGVYCSNRRAVLSKHLSTLRTVYDVSRKRVYGKSTGVFTMASGRPLRYQAVVSDERLVVIPLFHTTSFKEESVVFEIRCSRHNNLFQHYLSDISRLLGENKHEWDPK